MATGTVPSSTRPTTNVASAPHEQLIDRQLAQTGRQVKLIDILSAVAWFVIGLLVFLLGVTVIDHWVIGLGTWSRAFALLALVGGSVWFVVRQVLLAVQRINPVYSAHVIEQSAPSLKNSLVNFLLFRSNGSAMQEVVRQSLRQQAATDLSHVPLDQAVDRSTLIKLGYAVAGVIALCAAYKILSPKDPLQTMSRVLAPWSNISPPTRFHIEDVQPGNDDVFFGQLVTVSARVDSHNRSEPGPVTLFYSTTDNQTVEQKVELLPTADGLRYEGRLPPNTAGMQQDLIYRIEAGDAITSRYRLTVIPAPTILVDRLEYQFPKYTSRSPQVIERQGDIAALEGTRVTIHARANQPIKSATIEFDPDAKPAGDPAAPVRLDTLPMKIDGTNAQATLVLELNPDRRTPKRASYLVRFITADGDRNESPVIHQIQVTPDLGPEIEILTPSLDRVAVPEDSQQKIELRAVDPDFALRRITLRAVAGGTDLLTKHLLDDERGQSGQAVVDFNFVPRELNLTAGDEVTFWGVAEDNRTAPVTDSPDPNTQRTRNYFLRITAAERSSKEPKTASTEGEGSSEQNNSPDKKQEQAQDDSTTDPPAKSQEKKKDADSKDQSKNEQQSDEAKTKDAKSEQNKKDKGSTGNKKKDNQGGDKQPGGKKDGTGKSQGGGPSGSSQNQNSNDQETADAESGTGGNSKEKPSNKPGPNTKPAQRTPGANGNSEQNETTSSDSDSVKPGEQNSQKTRDKNSTDRAPKQNGPRPDATTEPTTGDDMNREDQGNDTGTSTKEKSGADKKPPSASSANQDTNNDPSATNDPANNTGAQPSKTQNQPGQTPQGSDPREAPHDGEVIEKALEHLKKKEKNHDHSQGQCEACPTDGSPCDKCGKGPSNPNPPKPQNVGKPGGQEATDSPSQGEASNSSAPKKNEGPGGKTNDQTQTKPEKSNEKKDPDKNKDQPARPGSGGNGESGAGEASKDKQPGSPQTDEQGKDTEKNLQPDSAKPTDTNPAKSPSKDKKQSDSKSDQEGEQRGGGKAGAGQGANQKGNDSAGSNSPADQGADQAKEKGVGDTSKNAGEQQPANGAAGKPSSENGPGSQPRPDKNGTQNGNGEKPAQPMNPSGTPTDQQSKKDNPPQPGNSAANQGSQSGAPAGGNQSSNDPTTPQPAADVPDGDAANLEYARKATELALQHLKDQAENPDRELLEDLRWTKEDLQRFLERWQSLKKAATEEKNPDAHRNLDETLRSLGLRPTRDQKRNSTAPGDTLRGNRDAGNRSAPPSTYQDQFNAFRKKAARNADGK